MLAELYKIWAAKTEMDDASFFYFGKLVGYLCACLYTLERIVTYFLLKDTL